MASEVKQFMSAYTSIVKRFDAASNQEFAREFQERLPKKIEDKAMAKFKKLASMTD